MYRPSRPPPLRPGEAGLRRALRRLARRLRELPARAGRPAPPLPGPTPETDWEHAAEERLRRIEQQLNNQNRLLLFTLVSIAADLWFRFTR